MKVPEPKRKPSGNWFIQLRLGGKSYSFTESTPKACRDAARTFKADYLAGRSLESIEAKTEKAKAKKTPTLGEVVDVYIGKHEAVLSPSTVRGYKAARKNRFQRYMGDPIDEIDYQELINEEVKSGVSPKTIKNSWALIAVALKVEHHKSPSVMLPQVPVVHKPYLRPDEIIPFCDAIKGDIAEIASLLELHGLRRSEAAGLDWKDVDLKRELIYVRGALVMGENGPISKDTNKNATSTRTVHIVIPQLLDALKSVKEKKGRVVTVSFQTMLRHTKLACERAGVTIVGNHGLRYSCASLAYYLGISERQLMAMCGWADYGTMHKIYVRISEDSVNESFNGLKKFFENRGTDAS